MTFRMKALALAAVAASAVGFSASSAGAVATLSVSDPLLIFGQTDKIAAATKTVKVVSIFDSFDFDVAAGEFLTTASLQDQLVPNNDPFATATINVYTLASGGHGPALLSDTFAGGQLLATVGKLESEQTNTGLIGEGKYLLTVAGTVTAGKKVTSLSYDAQVLGTAVPEPATWAAMLLGFGGIGATMRRRRSQALTA